MNPLSISKKRVNMTSWDTTSKSDYKNTIIVLRSVNLFWTSQNSIISFHHNRDSLLWYLYTSCPLFESEVTSSFRSTFFTEDSTPDPLFTSIDTSSPLSSPIITKCISFITNTSRIWFSLLQNINKIFCTKYLTVCQVHWPIILHPTSLFPLQVSPTPFTNTLYFDLSNRLRCSTSRIFGTIPQTNRMHVIFGWLS